MATETLIILIEPSDAALKAAVERLATESATILTIGSSLRNTAFPPQWRELPVPDLLETGDPSQEFLRFLDAWPCQTVGGGRTFDETFRRAGGYSTWWTGPGRDRHPDRGGFPALKVLWLCDRALRAVTPDTVWIHTSSPLLSALLASRLDGEVRFEFLPGAAQPAPEPWHGRYVWLVRSLARLPLLPFRYAIRAVCARLLGTVNRAVRLPPRAGAVVMVCEASRDIRHDKGRLLPWFWEDLHIALAQTKVGISCRYRVVYRRKGLVSHPAWQIAARLQNALPADDCYPAFAAWWRALPEQVVSIIRYFVLEGSPSFRASFKFAGADVSRLYVGQLRAAVARSADWAQAVAAAARSLTSAGPVSALLVVKEMYASEMMTIAAARSLGIPTVGVQHGTISPSHLMYTLPKGYLEGAPVPDYFAVYGEFAKETVSGHGAYPAERVWVTGAARFDHLVATPRDRFRARAHLGLPEEGRVLLLTSQSYPWFAEVAATLAEEARLRADWMLCVKTHPLSSTHTDLYRDLASSASNIRLFDSHLYDLVAACDVLISGSSTTILEAVLADRPTICVNFSADRDQYPYVEDGGALPARSPSELKLSLETVFATDRPELRTRRRAFLDRHAGPAASGQAADTLAARVVTLISKSGRADRTTGAQLGSQHEGAGLPLSQPNLGSDRPFGHSTGSRGPEGAFSSQLRDFRSGWRKLPARSNAQPWK